LVIPSFKAAMELHLPLPYFKEIVVLLVVAGIAVPLLHRLRLNSVLGYVLLGALVGPFGLGLWVDFAPWLAWIVITDVQGVQRVAELGVIFLLFVIGLELSFARLWAMRRLVFGFGGLQIIACGSAIFLCFLAAGIEIKSSLVLAACLALSSTAIVMQLLQERGQSNSAVGQSSFAVLLMQDLAVVPILFLVGVLAAPHGFSIPYLLGIAVFKAVSAVAVIYLAGRLLMRPLMRMVAGTRSPEMFMAATLLIIIGTAALTGMAGLSMALGAFLAGLLLAETEYQHRVEVDIEPFKGLLLGLFFIGVGMGVDYRLVWQYAPQMLLGLGALLALKTLIIFALGIAFRLPRHVAIETGLLLSQGGEFAFVVLALATKSAVIEPQLASQVAVLVSLSMLTTPLLAWFGQRLGKHMHASARSDGTPHETRAVELHSHIIIAGFGRVGQALARILDQQKQRYIAYDLDAEAVAKARARGLPVYFGDASRLEILERANFRSATSLVVTTDQHAAADRIVRSVRKAAPSLPIFARARDPAHAQRLLADGATVVVPEALEASLQLATRVLSGLGISELDVAEQIAHEREFAMRKLV